MKSSHARINFKQLEDEASIMYLFEPKGGGVGILTIVVTPWLNAGTEYEINEIS